MKNHLVKYCLVLLVIALAVQSADAQRSGRRRAGGNPTTPGADTTKPVGNPNQQINNTWIGTAPE